MDLDTLKSGAPQLAASTAFYAAANIVTLIDPAAASLAWPSLGAFKGDEIELAEMAAFCRDNATAPPEALYRRLGGARFHYGDADGFGRIDLHFRLAYAVFARVLPVLDAEIAGEIARLEEVARAAAGPVVSPAMAEDPEGTIREMVADPLATREGYELTRTGGGYAQGLGQDAGTAGSEGSSVGAASPADGDPAAAAALEPAPPGDGAGASGAAAAAEAAPADEPAAVKARRARASV